MPTSEFETISYASFHPRDFREVYEAGNSNDYAAFYFRRSAITNNYSRSYQKIDDLISYIGGFF